ncbi:MAG TPA: GGDEF domain-containing protein [Thermoleophilaceae bacterium]|nr:GGDEF domain-containing protein [Thermoleophilaceae bacterium]
MLCLKAAAIPADTPFMGGAGAAETLDVESDSSIRARALGLLYVAGGTIGVVSMVLPHGAHASEVALWSNIGLAYVAGGLLLAVGGRFPGWAFHVFVALGSAMVMRAVLVSGDGTSFYSVWFLWIGLYAFYFFNRLAACAHVALAAALYAVTLIVHTPPSPLARWLTTVATLVIAGLFIDTLVRRSQREAQHAAASAQLVATVADVAHELARVSDSEGARHELCAAAARLAQADTVALWEPATSGASLQLTGVAGPRPAQRSLPFVATPGGAVRAFAAAQTVREPDGVTVHEYTGDVMVPRDVLWQPVMRDSVPVAVLAFYWRTPAAPDLAVTTLASLLAAEAGVTLERVELLSRLESMARTDDLTGLPNRRAWEQELPRELLRAKREQRRLCVAMIDLDHFKHFNDERGHQAGDRLLKQAAAAWASELRGTDVLARYGGEEFVLALPGCTPEQSMDVAERLRAVMPDGETCSIGIAEWNGAEDASSLLGRADAALYQAKHRGRDVSVIV